MTHTPRVRAGSSVFSSGAFFTPWSWILTAPFALTVLGGHDAASTPTARLAGLAIAAGVHVICGLLGLVAAGTERATTSRRMRVGAVVVALVVIGIMRPLLIGWFTRTAGLPAFPVPISLRIATNIFAVVVATTLVAILVRSLRSRRQTVAELGIVAGWLLSERTYGRRLAIEVDRVLSVTEKELRSEVDALEESGVDRSSLARAAALREFGSTVLRSASRRLYELREGDALAEMLEREHPPIPSLRRPAMRVVAAAPGVPIALYVVLLAPFALARLPLAGALTAAALAGATGYVGELLLRTLASRAPNDRRMTAAVFAGIVVVAMAILAVTAPFVGGAATFTAPALYAVLAIMCAAVTSLSAELRAQETLLSAQIRTYRADEHDGHRRAEQRLFDAAQVLHGRMQSICLVAAMKLDEEGEQGPNWEAALRETRDLIDGLRRTPLAPSTPAEATLDTLLEGWRRVIDIRLRAEDSVWEVADRHPEILQPVLDALSEAFTNILRHGTERVATVALSDVDGRLQLTVDSPGGITAGAGDGIGLRALRARAESADVRAHGDTVRLTVSFHGRVREES